MISKEYAMNTMLKAEMMKNKPRVPGEDEKPLRSSLSPHYRRARQLQKAIQGASGGDNATTRAALISAKIELSNLIKTAEE